MDLHIPSQLYKGNSKKPINTNCNPLSMNPDTEMEIASPTPDTTNTAQQPAGHLIPTRNIPLRRRERAINCSKIALIHFVEAPHNNTVTTAATSPGGDYLIIRDDRGQIEVCATYSGWMISVLKWWTDYLLAELEHGGGAEPWDRDSWTFMASPAWRPRESFEIRRGFWW